MMKAERKEKYRRFAIGSGVSGVGIATEPDANLDKPIADAVGPGARNRKTSRGLENAGGFSGVGR